MRAKKTKTCFSQEPSMEDPHNQSSPSAASIGSNNDLLTEILLWLPVISILRFKCVSKHLRSLLSHPTFTRRYDTKHFHKFPLGLFTYNDRYLSFDDEDQTTPPFRNFDFFSDPLGARIVQSCNGLLLCCSEYGFPCDRKYYVLNPTTRQFVLIPSVPGGKAGRENICFMGLAFDQTASAHYKVVCVLKLDEKPVRVVGVEDKVVGMEDEDEEEEEVEEEEEDVEYDEDEEVEYEVKDEVEVEVENEDEDEDEIEDEVEYEEEEEEELFQIQTYSSDTREWKISVQSFCARGTMFYHGAYWNGAINWAFNDYSCLYFKVDVEQLHSVPLPVDTNYRHLGESRGHLHLVAQHYRDDDMLHLEVYEMSMDHSGWFVKYQVVFDEPGAFPRRIGLYVDFIDVIGGEADEDTFIVLVFDMKVVTYNVHNKIFKEIFMFDNNVEGGISFFHKYFHRYAQTLASV